MALSVNIGEAKAKLSSLIAAARRGEDVVIAHNGIPKVRLTVIGSDSDPELSARAEKRRSAYGMWSEAFRDWDGGDIGPAMTDDEVEIRWKRKFAPPD